MNYSRKQVQATALRLADPVLSAFILFFSVSCMNNNEELYLRFAASATFFMISISFALSALKEENKKSFTFIKYLIFVTMHFISFVICFAMTDFTKALCIIGVIYFTTLTIDAVHSFIKHKGVIRRILCVIGIILYILIIISYSFGGEIFSTLMLLLSIIVSFKALCHIISASFSKMQFGVLQKIIRKTFAGEILFGMCMLILACSIVLPAWEPEIKSFSDALWYCFAVVTTIGFGDLSAVTTIGRVLTVLLGIYGIILVSLITSIIINFYNEVKHESDDALPDNGKNGADAVGNLPDGGNNADAESAVAADGATKVSPTAAPAPVNADGSMPDSGDQTTEAAPDKTE